MHRNTVVKQLRDKYLYTSIKQNTLAGFGLSDCEGIMYEDVFQLINGSLSSPSNFKLFCCY